MGRDRKNDGVACLAGKPGRLEEGIMIVLHIGAAFGIIKKVNMAEHIVSAA